MGWPPKVGEPLPRAEDAWFEWAKVESWVLDANGHGSEWRTVFRVGIGDWPLVWETMVEEAVEVPIKIVRDRSPFGIICGVDLGMTVKGRSAKVTLSLHYADEDSLPRLVTAYPNL